MRSTMQRTPLLISSIFDHGTRLHGDQEAVTWTAEGPRRTSYRQVGVLGAQLAHALRGLGIDGDQRVATFMWNNTEHLTAYLAVPSMGAVLHALNIRLAPQQIVYVANHAEDRVVLVDDSLAAPFSQLLPHLRTVRHVVVKGPVPDEVRAAMEQVPHVAAVHDWATLLAGQPERFDWPVLDENDASSMCYTSGTTGNPKGVAYSHRSNYLHSMACAMHEVMDIRQGDRLLTVVPMFHANCWGLPYTAFLTGASMVLPDRFLQAEPLARMIETERVTGGGAVPTIWTDLLRHLDEHGADTSSLRAIIVGGSACPPSLMQAMEQRHGIRITHAWGMTETSPLGSTAVPPVAAVGDEHWRYRYTQGRVVAALDARLVGPDGSEQPWDGDSVGELQMRGPWIAAGYYRAGAGAGEGAGERAGDAAGEGAAEGPGGASDDERFVDGWLRTGDVGSLTPDGYLSLTDRTKDVIKSGGEWISSVALENALMGHPGVREATVVGIPDERWGERPLATVVRAPGSEVDVAALQEHLRGSFARWQVPERWAFVEEVPKTSVGKFDKKVVRQRYAEGSLDVQTRPVAPEGPGEVVRAGG